MPDKEGKTLEERVGFLIKTVLGLEYDHFYHMCSDGGVENTGNSRDQGLGEKGLMYRAFHPAGCIWTWCVKHRLSMAFNDADLSLVHESLNKVSSFMKVANRWNKLKPHLELILKHTKHYSGDLLATEYHKQAANRIALLSAEYLGAQEDALTAMKRPLMGDKGRWLTAGNENDIYHILQHLLRTVAVLRAYRMVAMQAWWQCR